MRFSSEAVRVLSLAVLLVAAGGVSTPRAMAGPEDEVGPVVYDVGTVYTGTSIIRNARILVVDGTIKAIGETVDAPAKARVVDWSDRVVIPGLVNALTYLGGSDGEQAISPRVRAVDGIDRFAKNRRMLRGGVTATYVAPARGRLVSGFGAVARTGGPAQARILADVAGLRVTLGPSGLNAPPIFEPPVPPTAKNPLKPARRQVPSTRASAMMRLRETFQAARRYVKSGGVNDPAMEALRPVLARKIPVRVQADRAADILLAIRIKEEFEVDVVLEGGTEAHRVTSALKAAGIPVVVNAQVYLQSYSADDAREFAQGERDLQNAGRLARAGVKVALCMPRGYEDDLLLGAGYAARFGMPADAALRAITATAAEVCGVERTVGRLATGHSADMVVLDRDPFDARAEALEVIIAGASVYERTESEREPADILAVRAARVLTMNGRTLNDATILIENGKIIDIGSAVSIPSTATVIDVPKGVVTPGFIDCQAATGLHGDRADLEDPAPRRTRRITNVPFSTNLADVVRSDDPAYATLVQSGVTSVILAPPGTANAQLAAVKLGATDRDRFIVRRNVGVRYKMVLPPASSREAAAKRLDTALKRAKSYIEKREKYAKDLAAYKKEKAKRDAEARAEKRAEKAKKDGEGKDDKKKDKKRKKSSLASDGVASLAANDDAPSASPDRTGTVADDDKKKDAKKKKKPLKEPKEPKDDPSLDAWRAILEKRASLVILTAREDTIEHALEVCKKYDVKPVLQDAPEAHRVIDTVRKDAAGLICRPPFARRDKKLGLISTPRAVSDAGLPVGFYSGSASGAKFLGLHAAMAVRAGIGRMAALGGLTSGAAKLFHVEDRIGVLDIGRDGDLVVFSGDPFDLSSRIVAVVVNGRLVHDAREGAGKK